MWDHVNYEVTAWGRAISSLNANQFLEMWLNPQNTIHPNKQINKVSVDYYSFS